MRLVKKKLLELPTPQRIYYADRHFEVKATEEPYEEGHILVATIWYSSNEQPTYRVFILKDRYITLVHPGSDKEYWNNATIRYHATGTAYCWWKRNEDQYKVYADEDTITLLRKHSRIRNEDDAIYMINHLQESIREEKIEQREEAEQAVWDAELDTTPDYPEDLERWVKDTVFTKERYILYETTKNENKRGTCTYCGKKVTIPAIHNAPGKCPKCHSDIIYKNAARQKTLNSSQKEMKLVQMTSTGKVVIRNIRWYQKITIESWNKYQCRITDVELKRIFVNKRREEKTYLWQNYKNKRYRFCPGNHGYSSYSYNGGEYTYMDDKETIVNYLKGGMEYLPAEIFSIRISICKLIKDSNITGMVERLWKMGLHRLAQDITNRYTYANNEKVLFKTEQVENDDLRILIAADISLSELEDWKLFKKIKKRPTCKEIEQARKLNISLGRLAELAKYASIKKILEYLRNQPTGSSQLYKDYLDLAKELGFDTKSSFVLFPKELIARHDECVELKNEKANQKLKRKLDKTHAAISNMEKELNENYAVENTTCFIRAPHSAYEIVLEGQKLHHCVGGANYRDKMKEGKSFILFVRKKSAPEIPWWTIEVSNKHEIIQYHGWGNRDKDKKDVEPIMKKFRARLEQLKADKATPKIKVS